ncbi:hypothetical protein [Elizabethkingia miricola]|uniref:YcxB-like protein domain-containing protein n=1 Tax=Elizabethkingia miricola TaxID=172045 RepID=A0ABD5BB82_ELIMR|nr:hypothetical protein [Elizabethkingia miricola]MDQ8750717.1 hypothetical protein [Elizabethkingia miricola]UIO96696.1 hypothetical protein LYZ41_01130 [Elizabethkingia miricola]WER13484.1 hypothetical protein P0M31_01140 [Elizabethkingia miricola]WGL73657.1 hypothetical protein QFB80_01130 [Elizabethkingia miricola]WNG65383.1 hypothetical protein M9H57_01125 [Elizabethkingia miricola]
MKENFTLSFRGMTQPQYRLSIFFIIFSIFLIPTIFMTIVISYQLNKIPRAVGIMIMGIAAIIVFFILSFLFKKLLAGNFKIHFENKQAIISSKNINRVILYENIEKLEIRNNTDYSYLLFLEKDGKKTKIFVGMANLGMKTSTILTPADQLDPFFGKPDFEKKAYFKKSMEYILYTALPN